MICKYHTVWHSISCHQHASHWIVSDGSRRCSGYTVWRSNGASSITTVMWWLPLLWAKSILYCICMSAVHYSLALFTSHYESNSGQRSVEVPASWHHQRDELTHAGVWHNTMFSETTGTGHDLGDDIDLGSLHFTSSNKPHAADYICSPWGYSSAAHHQRYNVKGPRRPARVPNQSGLI